MNFKRKIIVILVIFGLITLALVVLVIYPLFRGIKKDSQSLIEAKKDLVLFQNKTISLERAKEIYGAFKSDLEKIEGLFIDPEIPIDLIKFWEKVAKDSGVSIDISPVSLTTTENYSWNSMNFQITLAGPFSNFLKFLEKTETSSYLIEVQNLTVRKLAGTELRLTKYGQYYQNDINATFVIKVYTK